MSITTYAELQTAAQNWLNRTDSEVTNRVTEFIALAEAGINRRLRVRQQETSADISITARTASLPTGFMRARRVYLNTSPVRFLVYKPPEEYWTRYMSDEGGVPEVYTLEGDDFVFGPVPSGTFTGKCLYWKRQDISASAHSLFTQNPDLYLFGTLCQAIPFLRGRFTDLTALWEGKFNSILEQVKTADINDRHAGSVLTALAHPTAV